MEKTYNTYNLINLCALTTVIECYKTATPAQAAVGLKKTWLDKITLAEMQISECLLSWAPDESYVVDIDIIASSLSKIVAVYKPIEIHDDELDESVPAGKPIKITITAGIDAGIVGAKMKCSAKWIVNALERTAFCLNSLSDEIIIGCR
jgi:hypothetical protein